MQEFQTNAERMNVWDLLEACILLTGPIRIQDTNPNP
jgi:hypothetical protein